MICVLSLSWSRVLTPTLHSLHVLHISTTMEKLYKSKLLKFPYDFYHAWLCLNLFLIIIDWVWSTDASDQLYRSSTWPLGSQFTINDSIWLHWTRAALEIWLRIYLCYWSCAIFDALKIVNILVLLWVYQNINSLASKKNKNIISLSKC